MAFNTGNPIGSTDARDRLDNTENMDYLENSTTELTHPDRLGTVRKTRHGMEAEHDNQISAHETEHDNQIARHESEFITHIEGMGWTPAAGSFQVGGTITDRNQTLYDEVSHVFYAWGGTLPKVVAASSTPETSGGIGVGAWSDKTDLMLRSDLPVMFDEQSLQNTAVAYGLEESTGGDWKIGETINIGDWRIYGNSVWTPNTNGVLCGQYPIFGELYVASTDGKIHIENCGDTSGNGAAAIACAIKSAKSAGVNEVVVSSSVTSWSEKIDGAGDVYWRGSGSIAGLYGVFVERESAGQADFFCKIDNLTAFSSAASPVVVVVGDSISALKPDALNTSQTLYELLVQKISQSFPDKDITFYNRAIGGQTIGNFDTSSLSNVDAPWYTVGTPWVNYVSSLAPDVVILHFGMNDTTESTLPQYISVITKLQAFAKVPDIVICTNMTPSRENAYETFGTLEAQLNRELTAGVQRGVSAFKGLSLIDFNRQFHAVRDGYDIRNSAMRNIHLNIAAPAGAYTSDVKTYSDFSFTLLAYTTNAQAVLSMFNKSPSTEVPFCVKTGPGYTDTIFFTNRNADDIPTSNLWLKLFCGSQALGYNYDTVDTGLTLPTGPFTLNVSVRDNMLTVSFGAGDPDKVFKYTTLIRNGGWFYPKFGYWENDTADTLIDNLFLDIGEPKKVEKLITDSELFGYYDGSAGLKYPHGGNSVNHPSSIGVNLVFKSLLDKCTFLSSGTSQASQAGQSTVVGITSFSNGFTSVPQYGTQIRGLIHDDGLVTIEGQVSNTAESLTKGDVICTLPIELRPSAGMWISTANYNSTTLTFGAGTVQYDTSDFTLKYLSGSVNVIGINFTFKK